MNIKTRDGKRQKCNCIYLLLIMIVLISCNRLNSDSSLEKKFEVLSDKARSDTSAITFQLDTLTDFSWDTAIIITPYYQIDKLESELKVNLNGLRKSGIDRNDGKNVLAFIDNGILINYLDLPRTKGDFSYINDSNRIATKNRCSFKMVKSDQKFASGQVIIQIIPI